MLPVHANRISCSLSQGVRVRLWPQQLLAALLVLAAVLLFGARGFAGSPQVVEHSVASLHSGSQSQWVDAAPNRIDAQLKRDRVWFDLPLLLLPPNPSATRFVATRRDAPALGPGRVGPRDLRLSHFRRRIPRMNSEEPPCG
ncbi:MAG: hypothetical protein ABIQ16_25410 [Polyangiaceae bacterium]